MLGWAIRVLKALPWVALVMVMARACDSAGTRSQAAAAAPGAGLPAASLRAAAGAAPAAAGAPVRMIAASVLAAAPAADAATAASR